MSEPAPQGWRILRQHGDEWRPISGAVHDEYRGALRSLALLREWSDACYKIVEAEPPAPQRGAH